jgi:hypothetical protein
MKDLANEAINVQDACNLSGVAHGFSRAMSDLCGHGLDTDARNTHPVAILWSDKIAHLTGTQNIGNDVVTRAYDACYALAGRDS